jgi:hypothetical protein
VHGPRENLFAARTLKVTAGPESATASAVSPVQKVSRAFSGTPTVASIPEDAAHTDGIITPSISVQTMPPEPCWAVRNSGA